MNMTGIEYTKIIDRKLSTKISIGYYLSLLVDKHQTIISPKNLSKLIHWYFFNVNPQLKASSYWSVAINNFLTIEYNVWNFLWNIIVN